MVSKSDMQRVVQRKGSHELMRFGESLKKASREGLECEFVLQSTGNVNSPVCGQLVFKKRSRRKSKQIPEIDQRLLNAAKQGQLELIKSLVDTGANLDAKDTNGRTGLMLAAEMGRTKVLRYLLSKGVDVDMRDKGGMTAVACAALNGRTSCVRALINAGCDVNNRCSSGVTPLHRAAGGDHVEVVSLLVKAGANLEARNIFGHRPLHRAVITAFPRATAALLEHGCDVNAPVCSETTSLMIAAARGYTDIVRILLAYNADVKLTSKGKTALELATDSGKVQIAELLQGSCTDK